MYYFVLKIETSKIKLPSNVINIVNTIAEATLVWKDLQFCYAFGELKFLFRYM